MQAVNDVGHSHDNDAGCSNALYCERPFGMRVSKYADAMTRVHTGQDDQGVISNQNEGASIAVQSVD